jgi:spermidine synthase
MSLSTQQKVLLYILFSLSGFSALVYEVLWTKHLSLTFGTTMIAVSIVAATFMAGLALGSYLLGKYADHETNLLRIYAYLELGIAIFALLFPPALLTIDYLHTYITASASALPGLSHAAHLVLSSLILAPPTIFMGGTFPLMCRYFARKKSGGQIGRLYAMNTLGATLGAFLAGYVLIPFLGLSGTNMLAVLINLVIAVISWHFSKISGITPTSDVSKVTRSEHAQLARSQRPVLIAIALIGFFSLSYEILWTRVFLLFLGSTSYAFSLILSSFLISIAVGGAIYARKVHPDIDEKTLFIRLTMLMGLSILVTVPFYDQLALVFQWAHEISGERWWLLTLLSGIIVFCTMCVPIIISGSLLPAAIAIINPGKIRTGEGVGLVVLHNTFGAVIGSLLAGFFLIPTLGSQLSFQLLAIVNILLGGALCYIFAPHPFRRLRHPMTAACVLAPMLIFLSPQWDQTLMNCGVYCYAPAFTKSGGIKKALKQDQILEIIEGIDTTVAIKESPDGKIRFLSVNGKTDASSGVDMPTQVLIGQLPLLLHPNPQDALVIGLGSGITLGGANEHPLRQLDCVEISPGVVSASRYFEKENLSVLADPKINLHIEDGRNLLLTSEQYYDVIVSQPSNPWQSGNANLFTHEFYQLGAKRLKERGLFCQWIGLYDITTENLQIALNTFLQTFPKAMVFKSNADLILIGAQHKLSFDYAALKRKMRDPAIQKVLGAINISSPGDIIGKHFVYTDEALRQFSHSAAINTDDFPRLEYSSRYNLGEKMFGKLQTINTIALQKSAGKLMIPLDNAGASNQEIAATLREIGQGYRKAGKRAESRFFLDKAATYENKKIATQSTSRNQQG